MDTTKAIKVWCELLGLDNEIEGHHRLRLLGTDERIALALLLIEDLEVDDNWKGHALAHVQAALGELADGIEDT